MQKSSKYVKMSSKNLNERYINKKMHGYFRKQLEKTIISTWRSINKNMASHFEGYFSVIHDQKVPVRCLKNKRDRDYGKQPICNNKCRLCKTNIEVAVHKISGCPNMYSRYYFPVPHDAVAKYLFQAHIKKKKSRCYIIR